MTRNLYVIAGKMPLRDTSPDVKLNYEAELLETYREIFPIHYAQDSIKSFNSALASYLPWLRDNGLYIWEVRNSDYDSFVKMLTSNLKNSTVVHYNCLLSNFYDWLKSRRGNQIFEQYGVQPINPIDRWNTPKRMNEEDELPDLPNNEVVNYYFQKEKAEFARALTERNVRQLLILGRQITAEKLMVEAGLRVDEVANLDWGDIDLVSMVIVVRNGKGNKDRVVDISSRLGRVLKWYKDQVCPLQSINFDNNRPVFLSERRQRISKKTIQGRNWLQQEKYGIPVDQRFSPHGLRRLYATNLYMELFEHKHPDPIMYIKGQLGHTYLSTTLKYCRIPQSFVSRVRLESIALMKSELEQLKEE